MLKREGRQEGTTPTEVRASATLAARVHVDVYFTVRILHCRTLSCLESDDSMNRYIEVKTLF